MSLFDELSKEGRAVMPAPQRMLDPESKAYKPFLSEFEYTPGGRYVEMGATKQDVTGQYPKSAVIKIEPDGKAKMLVSGETRDTDESTKRVKGKGIVRTNLFKQEGGWKWKKAPKGISPDYDPKFPVVSVEKGRNHFYALEAEYPEGVEMSRYPDKDSEPRLRPTKYKGEVELGKKVGEIRTNSGKIHPVYDKLKIFGPAGAAVGLGLSALGMSDDVMAGGIDLDETSPGAVLDFLAPLGFEIPTAGEGSDVVPMDEQGEPVYPFLDEIDMRNNMLMRNPLLD
tara:strand:- start:418 stop:1266 length:849 start_codon:yes stop_codon:yes gene_type:complete